MWTAEYRALLKALTWWLIAAEIATWFEPSE